MLKRIPLFCQESGYSEKAGFSATRAGLLTHQGVGDDRPLRSLVG